MLSAHVSWIAFDRHDAHMLLQCSHSITMFRNVPHFRFQIISQLNTCLPSHKKLDDDIWFGKQNHYDICPSFHRQGNLDLTTTGWCQHHWAEISLLTLDSILPFYCTIWPSHSFSALNTLQIPAFCLFEENKIKLKRGLSKNFNMEAFSKLYFFLSLQSTYPVPYMQNQV